VGKVPEGRTRTNSNEKAGIGGEILGLFEREFNSNKLVRSPFLKASIARETAGSTPWECGEEIFFRSGGAIATDGLGKICALSPEGINDRGII
jgi:hypothetical protein